MENCLVKSLLVSANNDNLSYLGGILLTTQAVATPDNTTQYIKINTTGGCTVKDLDGEESLTKTYGSAYQSELELGSNGGFYVKNGSYNILVESKYDITIFVNDYEATTNTNGSAFTFNAKELVGCPNITKLGCAGIGNVKNPYLNIIGKLTTLQGLSLSPQFYGDLSDLTSLHALVTLDLTQVDASKITGNVDVFTKDNFPVLDNVRGAGKFAGNIKDISAPVTVFNIQGSSTVVGNLEDFVRTQVAAGRTEGSCKFAGMYNMNLYWKGVKIWGSNLGSVTWGNGIMSFNGDSQNI